MLASLASPSRLPLPPPGPARNPLLPPPVQELLHAGITCLSIAHRPALRRFHTFIVHFDGSVHKSGLGWKVEEITPGEAAKAGGSRVPSPSLSVGVCS